MVDEDDNELIAWDDVKGGELRVEDVKRARKEEVEYMEKRGLWKRVSKEECWRVTGKAPVSTWRRPRNASTWGT